MRLILFKGQNYVLLALFFQLRNFSNILNDPYDEISLSADQITVVSLITTSYRFYLVECRGYIDEGIVCYKNSPLCHIGIKSKFDKISTEVSIDMYMHPVKYYTRLN